MRHSLEGVLKDREASSRGRETLSRLSINNGETCDYVTLSKNFPLPILLKHLIRVYEQRSCYNFLSRSSKSSLYKRETLTSESSVITKCPPSVLTKVLTKLRFTK